MAVYADTDGSVLTAVEETTFNTTPANSANWKTVRAKGWNMKPAIATIESEELSANVDVRGVTHATQGGNITITGEYQKDAFFETMLEHLFRGAFATNVLKGGVVKKSMSFQELIVGAASEYGAMAGCRADMFSMQGRVGQIIETSFSFNGGYPAYSGTDAKGTGSVAAPGANRSLALADMTSFAMVGDTTTLCVLEFALQIQNNTRDQFGAGSKSKQGVGYGTRRCSGSFSAYFETREQFTSFTAAANKDLSFVLTDGTNSHTWRIPSIKLTDGDRGVSGRSNDIVQRFEFTAQYDATAATAVMVTRTP